MVSLDWFQAVFSKKKIWIVMLYVNTTKNAHRSLAQEFLIEAHKYNLGASVSVTIISTQTYKGRENKIN